MFKKPVQKYHINPKFRAFGRARIDIAQRARNREDWDRMWKEPIHPFAFRWEGRWKQCMEYRVDDFPAEVGFFIDVLGLPVLAFDPDYIMFTSPDQAFTFAVAPAPDGFSCTPPDAVRIQFMITDLLETAEELSRRGIVFEQFPQPVEPDSELYIGYFRTPHGICVDLWGQVTPEEATWRDINESQGISFVSGQSRQTSPILEEQPDEAQGFEQVDQEGPMPKGEDSITTKSGKGHANLNFFDGQDGDLSELYEFEYEDEGDIP